MLLHFFTLRNFINAATDDNADFQSVVAAQGRVESSITYHIQGDYPCMPEHDGIAVYDLSRRNVLSEDVVTSVISTFVNADAPAKCKDPENDFALHADLIRAVTKTMDNKV